MNLYVYFALFIELGILDRGGLKEMRKIENSGQPKQQKLRDTATSRGGIQGNTGERRGRFLPQAGSQQPPVATPTQHPVPWQRGHRLPPLLVATTVPLPPYTYPAALGLETTSQPWSSVLDPQPTTTLPSVVSGAGQQLVGYPHHLAPSMTAAGQHFPNHSTLGWLCLPQHYSAWLHSSACLVPWSA